MTSNVSVLPRGVIAVLVHGFINNVKLQKRVTCSSCSSLLVSARLARVTRPWFGLLSYLRGKLLKRESLPSGGALAVLATLEVNLTRLITLLCADSLALFSRYL